MALIHNRHISEEFARHCAYWKLRYDFVEEAAELAMEAELNRNRFEVQEFRCSRQELQQMINVYLLTGGTITKL